MLILGMDTTGGSLSVGLSDGDAPLGEIFVNNTKKHSQTLMPAVDSLLKITGADISQIDVFAVSIGPGSFTGIRIGAASTIALAQAGKKKAAQVDTLWALCENVQFDGLVCAIMDARHEEVFASAYKGEECVLASCAINIDELCEKFAAEKVMFVGDGIDVYREKIKDKIKNSAFANKNLRYQRGLSVCKCAYKMAQRGRLCEYAHVTPIYLKLSQAERMKLQKEENK